MQQFYYKIDSYYKMRRLLQIATVQLIRNNFILKKKFYKTRAILKNSRKRDSGKSLGMPCKEGGNLKSLKVNYVETLFVGSSQTDFSGFYAQKRNLESKPLKRIISRFEMNVTILFYTM